MAAKKKGKKAEKITPAVEKEVKATVTETVKAEVTEEPVEVKMVKEEKTEDTAVADTTKKTTTKKTTTTKTTRKTAPKKETVAKKTVNTTEEKKTATVRTPAAAKKAVVYVEFDGKQVSQEDIVTRIIEKWCSEEGKKASAIKEFSIYIKPEDNAAYYVINGQGSSIQL